MYEEDSSKKGQKKAKIGFFAQFLGFLLQLTEMPRPVPATAVSDRSEND